MHIDVYISSIFKVINEDKADLYKGMFYSILFVDMNVDKVEARP